MTGTDRSGRRRFLQLGLAGLPMLALAGMPVRAAGRGTASGSPVAMTRSGAVRGHADAGLAVFRGIPYGADTGPRRFLPPVQEAGWSGIREATAFGASAPQLGGDASTNEACLFLNVTTPGVRDGGRRPILVYIHGGAYNTGSGSDPLYDGRALARRGDVVVVTVNHRLNAFGYLYLGDGWDPALGASGNVGQLDLVQALLWVRAHAAEFGGDPANVTVFGQSGGGAKIATLMAMPAAAGLFHKAMTMSGQQVTAAGPRAAGQRTDAFIAALGLAHSGREGVRTLPAAALLAATRTPDPSRIESMGLYFGPVLDGRALPRHPFYPDAPPQSARIPMVIGNTHDETRAFLGHDDRNFSLTWDDLPARLVDYQYVDLPAGMVVAEYRRLYPAYSPSQVFFAATTAGRSWRGAVEEAEARARQGAPTWVYQLDFPSPRDGGRLGAFHTLDIPLVFGTTAVPTSATGTGDAAQRVSAQMGDALIALARHGDPNHAGIPAWPMYGLERRETLCFDASTTLASDPRGGERRLYQRAPFLQRGTQ